MNKELLIFIYGLITGCIFFEPIIINFIYFTNINLFLDIILTKKNKERLINNVKNKI